MIKSGVSIVIPTYNGGEIYKKSMESLMKQDYQGDKQLIVIDSGSTDNTLEVAKETGAEITQIEQKNFHHSKTRNLAVQKTKYDKVVFLVQDAIPCNNSWLSNLVESLTNHDVSAVYGKQVPHDDAELFARFEVDYHASYLGELPLVQRINSIDEFYQLTYDDSLRNIRFDNVCAIYKKEALLKIPFPDVPFGEDMAWAFETLKCGGAVLYQPEVKVFHSHNRNPKYRFRRAIIDTVVCAQTLGKTRQDISSFTYADLLYLSEATEKLVQKHIHELGNYSAYPDSISVKRSMSQFVQLPFVKKIAWFLIKHMQKNNFKKAALQAVLVSFDNHIRFVLNYLKDRYENVSKEELIQVIEQLSGSMQGGFYGEVYASYLLKGEAPLQLRAFIEENTKGV